MEPGALYFDPSTISYQQTGGLCVNRSIQYQRTRGWSPGVRARRRGASARSSRWLLPLACTLLPLLVAANVAAAPSITLYRGEPTAGSNIELGGWGSGSATDTSAEAFSGSNSIKVNTDGYYAGGRLMFH